MNDIFASVNRTRFAGSDLETAEEDWRDSRRNVLQVLRADMVYAVAYRSNPSPETPTLDIGGGTGWACQCYVNRFVGEGAEPQHLCRLYFYDDGAPGWAGCLKDSATHRRWNRWDPAAQVWIPLEGMPPTPSGIWAGIGATRLDPEFGMRAIDDLTASAGKGDTDETDETDQAGNARTRGGESKKRSCPIASAGPLQDCLGSRSVVAGSGAGGSCTAGCSLS